MQRSVQTDESLLLQVLGRVAVIDEQRRQTDERHRVLAKQLRNRVVPGHSLNIGGPNDRINLHHISDALTPPDG